MWRWVYHLNLNQKYSCNYSTHHYLQEVILAIPMGLPNPLNLLSANITAWVYSIRYALCFLRVAPVLGLFLQSVDNLCTHSMSAKLYENLRQLCESYILSCLDQFVVDTIDTEQFLKLMSTTWQNHCNQMVSCLPRFRMPWELRHIWLLTIHRIWCIWPFTRSGGRCPQTEDDSKIDIEILRFSLTEKGYCCVVVACGLIFWATLRTISIHRHWLLPFLLLMKLISIHFYIVVVEGNRAS